MAIKLECSGEALEDIESVVSKFFEKVETLQEFSKLGCKVPEFNDTYLEN